MKVYGNKKDLEVFKRIINKRTLIQKIRYWYQNFKYIEVNK